MPYGDMTAIDAARYLRQKTRTTHGTPTWAAATPTNVLGGNPGAWEDEIVVDYMNVAIRQIVNALSTEFLGAYYGRLLTEQVVGPGPEFMYEVLDGASPDYGVIKPGWVRYAKSSSLDRVDLYLQELTPNRLKFHQMHQVDRMAIQGPSEFDLPYYSAYYMADTTPSDRRTVHLYFSNWDPADAIDLLVYRFPNELDRNMPDPSVVSIPLPPMTWNAFLTWTALKMLEDEGNPRAAALEEHYQREETALLSAGVFNYDLPTGVADKVRANTDVLRQGK